jgi:hypothetical protein
MRKRSCLPILGLIAGFTTQARSVVDSPEALRLEQTCDAALAFSREPLRTRDQAKIEGPKIVAACQEALSLGFSSPRAGKANLHLGVIRQHLGAMEESERPLREAIRLGSGHYTATSSRLTVRPDSGSSPLRRLPLRPPLTSRPFFGQDPRFAVS